MDGDTLGPWCSWTE